MSDKNDLNDRLVGSLKSLEETEAIASSITNELYSQRLKLEKTKEKMIKIDDNLRKCEKTTNNITSFWNNLVNFFTGTHNKGDNVAKVVQAGDTTLNRSPQLHNCNHKRLLTQNDDDNEIVLSNKILNLKNSALDMGKELDNQNQLLDDMNQSVTSSDYQLSQLSRKINKLL